MADKAINVKSVKQETDKAWLTVLEDGSEVWFPKSQCTMENDKIHVPGWLVKAKDLGNSWDN